ncbi:hypothetical protein [uncultured Cohaesibacter sp.]|uniref:hypothetical protein n=1 Tax=uncultured Cohaesibacter sp. TaxID=1002546 RepID=UPI002AA5FE68|nr:hypothetical protein [uncultured Cohaesibacter sp.]
MDIYSFHPTAREFLGRSLARLDPLETEVSGSDVFLLPANATFTVPPTYGENEIPVFNGTAWEIVVDWRGTEYWLADGSHHIITDFGEERPAEALDAEPIEEPVLTQDDYEEAIQNLFEKTADSRRYEQGATAFATYVNSKDSEWAAEAQAFVDWRDTVWRYAYDQLNAVQAGDREQPSVEELLAELPEPNWPA